MTNIRLRPIRRAACAVAALAAAAVLQAQQPPAAPPNDLDAFMARVLEKRNENWRTLHDYILSERETFEILGPASIPLHGLRREFHWFVRDGYLIRSPLKANGVTLSESERQKYEDRWLAGEKAREKRARDAEEKRAKQAEERSKAQLSISVTGDVQFSGFEGQGPEPRFISEAYFMRFKFEPGNYYFAGREQLDGREVVKIEYLPSNLFEDDKARDRRKDTAREKKPERRSREDDHDERLDRAMNKTSTVTMWIDPAEHQIVRFTFDNVDWGFLPARQIARVDEARASMTMGRVFDTVWLPRDITFTGAATFATGTVRFTYGREFFDYRRGEVSAKIRGYVPKEPQ